MSRVIAISIVVFCILILWELIFPKRKFSTSVKIKSYLTDGLIIVSNNFLFFIFSIGSLYYILEKFFSLHILSGLDFSNIFIFLGMIVFLDLLVYFWHLLNHKISFLWMFHKAHHTEVYLNAMSGLRFHVGELLLSVIFKSLLLVVVFGIPIDIILISESLVILFSMFHHTNIAFRGEEMLSKLIIVPYLHQTHHSIDRADHDNNYGVVFSFWDRMFGTLLDKENKQIGLGNIKFQNFIKFLKFGFKYKY